MGTQWKKIGLIAAVLAIGSFSNVDAQRGGGGPGGGGGGGRGGGGGGQVGGGGGGRSGGGNFGGGGGGNRAGGGANIGGGGGARVGGGPGVSFGGGNAPRVGTPNLGGSVRQGASLNLNSNLGRIGVGANTNAGVPFGNLNNAINQATRGGPGGNSALNNRAGLGGVGAGFGNNYGGRYSSGYRGGVGNSFFFGVGSPFGGYYVSPFYRSGYGYGGPIYGYNRYGLGFGYGSPFAYGLGYGGYGGGYGGYSYGPSFGYQNVATYQPVFVAADGAAATSQPQVPAADTQQAQSATAASGEFALSGEQNFKAGKYNEAIRDWQHALVDEPRNGAYIMLLSQAFFATGKYNEAAGAVQAGTQLLPEKDWGIVIQNYKELYANQGDYTTQLRALEKARNDKSDDPALRFLLGWHYNYLGYGQQGLTEIDKAQELAPKDEITAKVRDVFAKAPQTQAPQAAR